MIATLVPYQIFPPKTGGQKAIALFTQYLAARIPLVCITVKSNHADDTLSYPVFNILSDSAVRYMNPVYFFTIRKLLVKKKLTHLIAEHPYYGWLAVLLQWCTPVKLVVRSHNIESLRWKGLGKWWWRILFYYEQWTHRQADYNLFITDEDRLYAIDHFGLQPEKCLTATFGITLKQIPTPAIRQEAATLLRSKHAIPDHTVILLFNGIFSYPPNAAALDLLVREIHPVLLRSGLDYRLIICGRDIPETLQVSPPENCICAGFVNDMNVYLTGADLFLNPIATGGGIKTKLVEALAHNLSAVSFRNGAIGIPVTLTGTKLHVVADKDVTGFCNSIQQALQTKNDILPDRFFEHFNWEAIAAQVEQFIHT